MSLIIYGPQSNSISSRLVAEKILRELVRIHFQIFRDLDHNSVQRTYPEKLVSRDCDVMFASTSGSDPNMAAGLTKDSVAISR